MGGTGQPWGSGPRARRWAAWGQRGRGAGRVSEVGQDGDMAIVAATCLPQVPPGRLREAALAAEEAAHGPRDRPSSADNSKKREDQRAPTRLGISYGVVNTPKSDIKVGATDTKSRKLAQLIPGRGPVLGRNRTGASAGAGARRLVRLSVSRARPRPGNDCASRTGPAGDIRARASPGWPSCGSGRTASGAAGPASPRPSSLGVDHAHGCGKLRPRSTVDGRPGAVAAPTRSSSTC